MPYISAEGRSLFVVSKLDQLRRMFALVRRKRMHGQLTEAPPKIDQLLRGYVLVSENDEFMLNQRIANRRKLLVRHSAAKIDATDLRAERNADFCHGHSS